MECENCIYWSDYTQRIWAVVSGKTGDRADGTIELRLCKYRPAPSSGQYRQMVYVDKEFSCSEFVRQG